MEEKKVKRIRPMFNSIVTTRDLYEEDTLENGIINTNKTKGALKDEQTVVAVGDMVRNIKVGDVVHINPRNYEVRKFEPNSIKNELMDEVVTYRFNTVELEGVPHLLLQDRDIDYIIEEYM